MATGGPDGWEDLAAYGLEQDAESELLRRQTECTFIWLTATGHPIGAVVNYIHRDGRFWLTATSARPRVAAVRADPRVSIAVSSKGSGISARRSLTYRGLCTVHDDAATLAWFLPEFSAAMRPESAERATEFAGLLDSPLRVVLEVAPQRRTGYDGAKMWAAAPGAAPTEPAAAAAAEPAGVPLHGTAGAATP